MAPDNLVILKRKTLITATAMWFHTLISKESFVEHSHTFGKSRYAWWTTTTMPALRQCVPRRGIMRRNVQSWKVSELINKQFDVTVKAFTLKANLSRGSITERGSRRVRPQSIATATKARLSLHNFNLILTRLGHAHPTLRMSAVNFRHVINMSSYFAVLNDNRAVLLIPTAFYAYKLVLANAARLCNR